MTNGEWINLAAILLGPIFAVMVTRVIDAHREASSRRMEIFKTLMRTRRTPTYPEHVGALNLIEVEYASDTGVMNSWRGLHTHFATQHVRHQDEFVADNMSQQEISSRNKTFNNRIVDERQKLLAKLLHSMAKRLNFKAEQLEIFEGGYTPQAWVDVEVEQHEVRKFIIDLAYGNKVVPTGVIDYREARRMSQTPNSLVGEDQANATTPLRKAPAKPKKKR